MKKKWFVKILKIIGLSMASVFGFLGAAVGVYALFGGFNEKVVKLEGMNFEQQVYVLDGNIHNEFGVYDNSVKLLPTNEDANRLDITLTGGENIVTLPTGKNSQVGKNLEIKLTTITDTNGVNNYTYNKGGEFILKATQEDTLLTTSTTVFVESKIDSFTLTDNLNGSLIYPGSKFKVSATNIFPANALNKPTNPLFYTTYGENYFNKTILYFSSNESIATVDSLTGDVTVLTEGDFSIFAYMPTTYKNNSLLPDRQQCTSDSEYFALLEQNRNNLPFTIKNTINYSSNIITVNGITASNNVFNLFVNETYKYSVDGVYESSDKQLNLNISLNAPQNSNYTSEQLNYKLQDVEIFEGYKDGENYYISANQHYNNGVLESEFFDIKQTKKPLVYTITSRDYTFSKDLYLVLRIGKNKLGDIGTSALHALNQPVEEYPEDYAYYAFVKVNTNIVENTALNVKTNKIMASYSTGNGSETDDYLFENNQLLDLTNLIDSILPENATYKNVRFYVRNNGTIDAPFIETTETNEIPYREIKDIEGNILYSGYFVKAVNEGTLQFYASVVKTDRNGENLVKLYNSEDITLIVTHNIELKDFAITLNNDDEYIKETNKYLISKGNSITITFTTTNDDGLLRAYQEGFFKVISSSDGKVSTNINLNETTKEIVIKTIEEGETTVEILFNGISLSALIGEYKIPLNLNIQNNDLQSINLSSSVGAINSQNYVNVEVNGTSKTNELLFNVLDTTLTPINNLSSVKEFTLNILLNGGSEDTILEVYSTNTINANFEIIEDLNKDRFLKITPKTLCENVEFYVYSMVGGNAIKSPTYKLNIIADYVITANKTNNITINLIEYEKVIGGEKFELLNNYINITTSNGDSFNNLLFELTSDENYNTGTSVFKDVTTPVTTVITLKPKFSSEEIEFNFYIIPKTAVVCDTLVLNAGSSVDNDILNSKVKLIQRSYDANGVIIDSEITNNIYKFYEEDTHSNEITSYTAPSNSFDNSTDTIYVKVNNEFLGEINVVINSNLTVENKNTYLGNGNTVTLTNLFKVMSGSNEVTTTDNNVVFTSNTFNKLKNYNITFYDENNNEIINYDDSFTTNATNPIKTTKIAKILIPKEFNTLTITDLQCYFSCKINGEFASSNIHNFSLDFEISTIEIDQTYIFGNTIYIDTNVAGATNTEIETYIKNNFVKSATIVNKTTNSASNIKDNVIVSIDDTNNVVTFKLSVDAEYFISYNINKGTNLLTKNSATEIYIGKAYSLNDLIINQLSSAEVTYISILKADGNLALTSQFSIENNHLIFKEIGDYSVIFKLLGNNYTIDYTVQDIVTNFNEENNGNNDVYSNQEYDLIKNSLPDGVKLSVDVLNKNGQALENEFITINLTNNKIIIGEYLGNATEFILRFRFYSDGFTSAIKDINFTLNSLYIQTNFTEIQDGRQVLRNKATHDLTKYFTVYRNGVAVEVNNGIVNNGNVSSLKTYELNIDPNSFTSNYSNFDLVINYSGREIGTVEFCSQFVDFVLTRYDNPATCPYYIGQELTKNELLSLVKVVTFDGTIITKYNNEITFEGISFPYTVVSGGSVSIKLGILEGTIYIYGDEISWIPNETQTINIYPDTRVYGYIKATHNSKELPLEYSVETSSLPVDFTAPIDTVNKTQTIIYNGVKYVTLNQTTGVLTVENLAENTISGVPNITIIAKVVNTENELSTIFALKSINKAITDNNPTIYIGDSDINLTQYAYFGASQSSGLTEYRISELVYDNALGNYSYHKNNATGYYEVLKNGVVVAKVKDTTFVCTSELDPMTIKLKGYIKHNNTSTSTCVLESLENNVIDLTLNFERINITFPNYEIVSFENNNYYKFNAYDGSNPKFTFDINPTIIPNNLKLEWLSFSSAFIGEVSGTNIVKQLDLNPSKDDSTLDYFNSIELPTSESVKIVKPGLTSTYYQLQLNANMPLSCYVFISLKYRVQTYESDLHIVLCPAEENIITFNYESLNSSYKTIYSPSTYVYTDGSIFKFGAGSSKETTTPHIKYMGYINFDANSNEVLVEPNQTQNKTEISSTATSVGKIGDGNVAKYLHSVTFSLVTSSYSLTFENKEADSTNTYVYTLYIDSYEYTLRVQGINVKLYNTQEHENNSIYINSVTNRLELGSDASLDFKNFITINDVSYYNAIQERAEYASKINFNLVNNGEYKVTSDGIFTPLSSSMSGTFEVLFKFYGKEYVFYIKGEQITFSHQYNGAEITYNENDCEYELSSGSRYYIYLTKNDTTITTNLCNQALSSIPSSIDGSLLISEVKYTYGGQEYDSTSQYFEINKNGTTQTIKFGGLTLLILTKDVQNQCYVLNLTNNISGIFEFNLKTIYSAGSKTVNILALNEQILINYSNPSIVNGKQYHNYLTSTDLNLKNYISGVTDEDKLEFSLSEVSSYVTVTLEGNFTTQDVYSEILVEVIVKYNTLQESMFIRVIPEYKVEFANTSREFKVLYNGTISEKIDLTKYAKAFKFTELDSENNPLYVQEFNYYYNDAKTNRITEYTEYTFSNQSENSVYFYNFTLKFKGVEPQFSDVTLDVGESYNLKSHVKESLTDLTIKNVSLSFFDSNNYVNEDGMFLSTQASANYTVQVTINGLDFNLTIIINELELTLTYKESILQYIDTIPVSFQTIYATQVVKLVKSGFIDLTQENKKLLFSFEVFSSNGYDLSKFKTTTEDNVISLFNNDVLLMDIVTEEKNSKYEYILTCYNNLTYETLVNISISVQDNNLVQDTFNVRLLPVSIKLNNNKTTFEISDNYFVNNTTLHLINNFVTCNTMAEANNINLNSDLKFKVDSVDLTGQTISKDTFNGKSRITVLAVLGEKQDSENSVKASFDIIYYNAGQANEISKNYSTSNVNTSQTYVLPSGVVGTVTAVRSCNDTFITYTIVINNGTYYYDVFDKNGNNLIQIYSNGNAILKTQAEFELEIEYFSNYKTDTKSYSAGESTHNVQYIGTNNENLVNTTTENGIVLITMLAGTSLDETNLQTFLNGGSIVDCSDAVTYTMTEDGIDASGKTKYKYTLTANKLTEITYGYFDVQFGSDDNATIRRIYVKVYPYSLSTLYSTDYTYPAAEITFNIEDGNDSRTITLIKTGDSFKTIFVASDNIYLNLYDYIALTSELQGVDNSLQFSLEYVVAYHKKVDGVANDRDMYIYFDKSKNLDNSNVLTEEEKDLNDYLSVNGNTLELKNNGTYYVKIKVTYNNSTEYLKFRILNVTNETNTTGDAYYGISLDLNSYILLKATNEDATFNGLPLDEINLFNNLNITLSGAQNSYINNGILYVYDKKDTQLTVTYNYNLFGNTYTDSITFTVQESSLSDDVYNLNGVKYQQIDYLNVATVEALTDFSKITFIKLNNETEISGNSIINTTEYSLINEIIKISVSDGTVLFYDILNIDPNQDYIPYNYVGIIEVNYTKTDNTSDSIIFDNLLFSMGEEIKNVKEIIFNGQFMEVIKDIELIGEAENQTAKTWYIVNNLIKIDGSNGNVLFYDSETNNFIPQNKMGVIFVTVITSSGIVNYKFNDYSISRTSSAPYTYTYKYRDEDLSSYLRFALIGEDGLAITGSECNGVNMTVNGITLNTYTGEYSGTITNEDIKVFIKAYVQESSFNTGDKFKLYEI
ncbi:MAG: hypothetical protein E7359_03245 [Clostridiales bacterium]|nr:hypothetical protein [Clostridiales bacterium]